MNITRYSLILSFLFIFLCQSMAKDDSYNVLFVQSYTPNTLWSQEMVSGLKNGFALENVNANITVEYLDADYWNYRSEKEIMKRFCERARDRKTDIIITASDEAFHTLMSCGDSLGYEIPVVFAGIKYPDLNFISQLDNVSGYTSSADFIPILEQANTLFPDRHEIVCILDSSFLATKGEQKLRNDWTLFSKRYPHYTMKLLNSQEVSVHRIITSICYENNAHNCIVIAPKWSPFLAFIGRNSKAPFFSCQNIALKNGIIAAYDADPELIARDGAQIAAQILKGANPKDVAVTDYPNVFHFDYKQLEYFNVDNKNVKDGTIINIPFWEQYKIVFILLNTILIILLVIAILWLVRGKRNEAIRRLHAQTRLLEQNYLITQRDEFDNIFHSIRDALVTYDVNYTIQITNKALLQMLQLPTDRTARSYEGMPAGTLFRIYSNGKEILQNALEKVIKEGKNYILSSGSFLKEVRNDNYFPISGELVPVRSKGNITGVAFSFRNVSEEEMQKHFFNLAVEDSSIYPWQYNVRTNCFTFPVGFLNNFGFNEEIRIISRTEIENLIYPDDFQSARELLSSVLEGKAKNSRMSFRMKSGNSQYEWWEFRTSVFNGLTTDAPYNILGVCQSIQRYKKTEEELIAARDKALETDKLKSAFLANMSHEIRTPLNAIVGFSDLLNDTSLYSEEDVQQFIGIINKNCTLLLTLINDILDLSRIESGSMDFAFANHSLTLIMKNIYDSQRINMPQGVQLVLDVPLDEKRYIVTDNVRLQQVINNLINNAAKFTTSGTITMGYLTQEEGFVSVFVEDTGKGMTEDSIKHIFDRFYKVDNFTQGAGLGLSICQTIVERLKGTILVTSTVGVGTRFVVKIPLFCE